MGGQQLILLDTHVWVWWITDKNKLNSKQINVIDIETSIIIKSTQLVPPFHNDPADQLIVATSIEKQIPLLTFDEKILNYTKAYLHSLCNTL
jgi:PIN domain nuclease of toxin-antitoxin system